MIAPLAYIIFEKRRQGRQRYEKRKAPAGTPAVRSDAGGVAGGTLAIR